MNQTESPSEQREVNQPDIGLTPHLKEVTLRSVIIGIFCVIGICIAGCVSAFLRYDLIGTGHLPRCALYPILVLLLLNPLIKKLKGGKGLNKTELLFIYCTILIMTGIPGQQFATYLYLGLVGPIYYATPQNQFADSVVGFHKYFKEWLVPSKNPNDPAIKWIFEGLPEGAGFFDIPWHAWVKPLAVWTPFAILVFFVTVCICVLLRKQWVERERLLFPLARVPVEIVEGNVPSPTGGVPTPLYKNKILWIAFAIPVVVFLCNGIQKYWPSFFWFDLRPNTRNLFSESPWTVFNWIQRNYYFGMIGISYMLTTEVGFSFWFFFLFQRIQSLFRIVLGMPQDWEFFRFQNIGGIIVLALFYLWIGREHFINIFKRAVFNDKSVDDSDEPLSYRAAFWGTVIGLLLICGWCQLIGLSFLWALLLFLFYFMIITILTRIVSEAGIFVWWSPIAPQDFIIRSFGTGIIGPQNTTLLQMVGWNIQDTATCVMPQAMNGFKIAGEANIRKKSVFTIMLISIVIAVLSCHTISIYIAYKHGVPNLGWWTRNAAWWNANRIATLLRTPQTLEAHDYRYMAYGGIFTLFLLFMRQRFLWWPFHPLGYIASISISGSRYWWSIFIGWSIKVIITKLGGIQLWRKYYPAALGLILGECVILFSWLLFHFIKPIEGVLIIE